MAASLSPDSPQEMTAATTVAASASGAKGGLLGSNSTTTNPRPESPDLGSLTVRPIQTPSLPHQMHHPQPQAAGGVTPLGGATPAASLQQQQQQQALPHSPRTVEQAMQAAITSTPPPRPARAPLRSPGSSLPRSPSAPALGDNPTIRLIQKALENSKDGGETLDLSRERIERISDQDVEFFRTKVGKDKKGVWRLALSYNALYDGSITRSFCTLNRLRYLNLKGNHLTAIPPALCEMQGLEILDLSKNQIATLPERPERLAHLKVLSLSSNALTMLPTYLVLFNNLKVFKVDHNPIEWPPKEILGPLIDSEPPSRRLNESGASSKTRREEDLRPWIEGMKIWLQEQITDGNVQPPAVAPSDAEGILSDSGGGDRRSTSPTANVSWTAPGPSQSTVKPIASSPGPTTTMPGAMPASSTTTSSSTAPEATFSHPPALASPAKLTSATPTFRQRNRSATVSEDSLIHTSASTLSLPAQATRHDRSISSSSSLTPPVSASTSSSHSGPPSAGLPKPHPLVPTTSGSHPPLQGHNRGGSYTVVHRLSGSLASKKSLPDLRKSHARIIEERRYENADGGARIGSPIDLALDYRRNLPLAINRKVSPPTLSQSDKVRTLKTMASMEVLHRPKEGACQVELDRRQASPGTPSLDESRNSYFRRLSMLPPSTISKAVSPAMLMFIDAIRGLLFALTQLHSALREYVNFAVSDRVAGVFARVLQPAGQYLSNLINALDRFDSTSRRSSPPVTAVRGVVDAAKECMAVFGKIVAVLRFQTPTFKDADVRYTRQLLLSIYGGMAEIAQSWRTMAPLLVEIRPLLHSDPRGLAPPMSKSNSLSGGRTPISPIPESGEIQSPERAMRPLQSNSTSLAPGTMPPVGSSPRGKSRRHAGSFSTEDVERGMLMGSPVITPRMDWPDLSRTIFEDNEAMADTAPPPFPLNAEPEPPHMTPPQALHPITTSFSQPPRSRHAAMSSAGSSFLYAPSGGARSLSVDVRPPTPASATLYDEDLLDVIETSTDLAFTCWLRLSEDIGGSSYAHGKSDSISSASGLDRGSGKPLTTEQYNELVEHLSSAEQVTTTLRESLMGLRANPFAYAHPSLPDNAQAFVMQVVKVLAQVRQLSRHHTFSTHVRHALSQLSQATKECAILIQVSSLQPSTSASASSSINLTSASDYRDRGGAGRHHGHGGPDDFKHDNRPDFSQYSQSSRSEPHHYAHHVPPHGQRHHVDPSIANGGHAHSSNGHSHGHHNGTTAAHGSGATSSNEDIPGGLRGLHLPRAREMRERVGAR